MTPPSTELALVIDVLRGIVGGNEPIDEATTLAGDLGLDSLAGYELVLGIEERVGDLDLGAFAAAGTVGEVAALVARKVRT